MGFEGVGGKEGGIGHKLAGFSSFTSKTFLFSQNSVRKY